MSVKPRALARGWKGEIRQSAEPTLLRAKRPDATGVKPVDALLCQRFLKPAADVPASALVPVVVFGQLPFECGQRLINGILYRVRHSLGMVHPSPHFHVYLARDNAPFLMVRIMRNCHVNRIWQDQMLPQALKLLIKLLMIPRS